MKLLGYAIESEVMTIDGRIDATLHTPNTIYILEFKMGDAQSALEQIKIKQYHLKYSAAPQTVILLGIGFDPDQKNIGDFLSEIVAR